MRVGRRVLRNTEQPYGTPLVLYEEEGAEAQLHEQLEPAGTKVIHHDAISIRDVRSRMVN